MKHSFTLLLLGLLSASLPAFAREQPPKQKAIVFEAIKHDVSISLKKIPPAGQPSGVKRLIPNSKSGNPSLQGNAVAEADPVIQMSFGTSSMPGTGQNFDGISASCCMPPDTNGDVGPNHYVQMVNRSFAIYGKSGNLIYGPANINTLWSGFGGLCESTNLGDPIVVYDAIADRWLISQFAYPGTSGTHYECVAVSTTSDPSGSYNRYAFTFPEFDDYPKIGVWPDAYYATFYLRKQDFSLIGGYVCAFDRTKMLAGAAATAQCFDLGPNYSGLLPSDLDGPTLPPAASPNYIVNFGSNVLDLWRFHVDWNTPANTSITGPIVIPVAPFSIACATNGTCIDQPGTTQKLDSFSDRLMFRLAYRNFGDHESLITNHTVDAGAGIAGIRWYELRNPGATPVLYQQGTYSPDTKHRWMGSAAIDRSGNIALGFSASSSSTFPSILYSGRLASDPAGTLSQGEATIMAGGGSQSNNRWGDYSALTIDPLDDCTFWFTSEYLPQSGTFNWHTRIASFRFSSCGNCNAPSGLINNTAVDISPTAYSGILVSWNKDPGNWGDYASANRTYDVLRNGTAIANALPYGTTSYADASPPNGQTFTYSVRYNNNCGQNNLTAGTQTADKAEATNCLNSSQLLVNPGFEKGNVNWISSPTNIIKTGIYPAHSGSWKSLLNGKGIANTARIYEQITIPSNACSATLSFWLRVVTSEGTTTLARDKLQVQILNNSGVLLKVLATYSNLNKSATYLQKSFNLIAYKGKTIRIRFSGTENSTLKTSFLIDDTAVKITR